jgi:hypothetical protein
MICTLVSPLMVDWGQPRTRSRASSPLVSTRRRVFPDHSSRPQRLRPTLSHSFALALGRHMYSSKSSMSGLRAVKRDWSTPSVDTDPIPWSSSPPHPSDPPGRAAQAAATAPAKSLSAAEKRLKLIQDALDSGPNNSRGVLASSVQPNANKVAGSSGSGLRASTSTSTSSNATRPPAISNKRSSESQESSSGPASKKRSLPESWSGSAATSQSSVKSASSASYKPSTKLNGPEVIKIAPSTDTGKVPKVFLSKEQQKILKLVEDGQSIFYTGSAGTSVFRCFQRKMSSVIYALCMFSHP